MMELVYLIAKQMYPLNVQVGVYLHCTLKVSDGQVRGEV